MTTSHWIKQHTFSSPDISTDVLIVGGGFAGLSTAYWISETRPDLKITLVDRGACGFGASGRNAGFLTKGSASFYQSLCVKWGAERALEILRFAEESISLLQQNILKASPEIKVERTTCQTLFQTDAAHGAWKDERFDPEKFGFGWKKQDHLPPSLRSKFFGALEGANEYKINPVQLMGSLKKLLQARKVQVLENVSVYEITPEGINTEINRIRAKQVVLALNGYFSEYHSAFEKLILPYRAQMVAVETDEELDCPALYYDPPERVYWRKTSSKVFLVGGKRLLDVRGEHSNFDKITPVIQQGLEAYLRDKLRLKYKVINRWSGIMGFTDHELPYICEVAAPVPTFMLGGFSGHGIGLGFKSGLEVAELVAGKKPKSFFSQFREPEIRL